MKPIKVLAILMAFGAGPAGADEIRATFGAWRYQLSGTADDAGTVYDFQRDLGVRGTGRRSIGLAWDTGPGWWPDLALEYAQIDAAGQRGYQGPPPFFADETIVSSADNRDLDLTARYPVYSGAVSASAGLSLKHLSGVVVIDDSGQAQPSRQRFDEVFPQAHLQLRWNLSRLLALSATGQGVEYRGDRAVEWRALAELRLFAPVLVEFGWQEKRYELTSGNYDLDARLRGGMLRVGVEFSPGY